MRFAWKRWPGITTSAGSPAVVTSASLRLLRSRRATNAAAQIFIMPGAKRPWKLTQFCCPICCGVVFKLQWLNDRSFRYQSANGEEPVTRWLQAIRDKPAQAKVRIRLKRLETGIFGDCKPVGDGVLELREHLGAGYRVYFGRHGLSIVILLCGGSKKTQPTDIKAAKGYWANWKRRQV